MSYGVYVYEFPDGMKYVGMTKHSIQERRDNGYQHNKELQSAIRKCGWKGFKHYFVATGLTLEEAEEIEKKTILALRSSEKTHGYNKSAGGRSTFKGLKHSEETKARISKANTGRIFSESHRQNLSKSLMGKNTGENNKKSKRVEQFTKDGLFVDGFINICTAAAATGIDRRCISDCANRKQKTAGGYVWKFPEGGDYR